MIGDVSSAVKARCDLSMLRRAIPPDFGKPLPARLTAKSKGIEMRAADENRLSKRQ
jgi:hypothetical protein